MLKRIIDFLKKYLHFKLIEVPLIVIFMALTCTVYYSISTIPNEKSNYIAQEIAILSKESEIGSFPIYFEQNSNVNIDNSSISKDISDSNSYNKSTSGIQEYKQLVCANLNDKEVKVNALEDTSPAVIMTSWSTFYTDQSTNDKIFMSNLIVQGLGTKPVDDYYFCYITTKQADYLIKNNSEYHSYNELINKKLAIQISYGGKSETHDFLIRDIIKSGVGNDPRYNELFGSYIVCYYIPFLKTTRYQMFYDLSTDETRNLNILNNTKEKYTSDLYSLEFLNSIGKEKADDLKNEFYIAQTTKDNTTLIVIILFISLLIFVFSVFFISEDTKEIQLSLAIIFATIFTLEYLLLRILAMAKVLLAIKIFTSSGVLFNFAFLAMTLLVIAINAFVKEDTKFTRKYVNEKHH